jgi:hypothetical protein
MDDYNQRNILYLMSQEWGVELLVRRDCSCRHCRQWDFVEYGDN